MRCPPLVLFVVAAACGRPARTAAPVASSAPAAAAPAPERTTLGATGIDPTSLDRSAAPCDDFYRFACEIPADLPSWRPATQLRAAKRGLPPRPARARAARRTPIRSSAGTIAKPVDPEDWSIPPITVDAFYSSSVNSMNFPVGNLQPPELGEHFAAAVNYGRIGSGVGHELTHGFDDNGAKYDGSGNLREWWSAPAKAEFAARTRCVIEQYNAYNPAFACPRDSAMNPAARCEIW